MASISSLLYKRKTPGVPSALINDDYSPDDADRTDDSSSDDAEGVNTQDDYGDYVPTTQAGGNGGNYLEPARQDFKPEILPPNSNFNPSSTEEFGKEPIVPLSETEEGKDQGQHPDAPSTSEEANASLYNIAQAGLSSAPGPKPPAGPMSAQDQADQYPALRAYKESLNTMPQQKAPKLWQRVAAGALGGVAGWQNATGHRGVPQIDPSEAIHNIYNGGYDQELANWNAKTAQLGKAATIEQQEERTKTAQATSAARLEDYKAAKVFHEYQLEKAKHALTPLSKSEQNRADYQERVQRAKENGWNEKDQPWLPGWLASGSVVNPPADPKAQAVPAELYGRTAEEIKEFHRLKDAYLKSQTNYENQRSRGGRAEKETNDAGLTPNQALTRQAIIRNSHQRFYADLRKEVAKAKADGTYSPEYEDDVERRKQEHEEAVAQAISDTTGKYVKPNYVDWRKKADVGGAGGAGNGGGQGQANPPESHWYDFLTGNLAPKQAQPGPATVQPGPVAQPIAQSRAQVNPAAPNVQKAKTLSPADVLEYAKRNRITKEQAERKALHEGWTLLGR